MEKMRISVQKGWHFPDGSVLDNYTLDNIDDIAITLAQDFRKRRIEKNMTREEIAKKSENA